MWRTGVSIGLGWGALFAGIGVGIWQFVAGDWVNGVIALAAGVGAMVVATTVANALTRTVNQ